MNIARAADKIIRRVFTSPSSAQNSTEMPTNKSGGNAVAKKKAPPPQPAMFRLHNPVPAPPDPVAPAVAKEEEGKKPKGVEDAETGWPQPPQPAVKPSGGPTAAKVKKSTTDQSPEDGVAGLNQKPAAKEAAKKPTPTAAADNESDKDSITGEINPKKSPNSPEPENIPDKPSIHKGSTASASNPKKKKTASPPKKKKKSSDAAPNDSFLDSDSDDEPSSFPKAAIKRPRNSASAEAYAKRMAEKEGAKKGVMAEGDRGIGGNDKNAEDMDVDKLAAKTKAGKKGKGKSGASPGKKASPKKGHVKTKHTPNTPEDLPPRRKSSRKSAIAEVEAEAEAGDLKSPPEEKKRSSSRSKKSTSDDNLKSPPEEIQAEEASAKKKGRSSTRKSKPKDEPAEEEMEEASPPPARKSRAAAKTSKKTPVKSEEKPSRRSSRKTSAVAEELVSNLEEDANKSARRTSKRKRDLPDDVKEEEMEIPPMPVLPAADESPGGSRRSKRSRKPSLAAEEKKKNEEDAAAIADSKPAVASKPSPKRFKATKAVPKKAPSKKEAKKASPKKKAAASPKPEKEPQPQKARTGPTIEYLESKKSSTWNQRVAMLKAHKEKYNTCDLTHAPKEDVPPLLRSFVLESRKQYKKFQRVEHSTLTAARIDELQKLEFDFSPMNSGNTRNNHDRRFQKQWDEQYGMLEKYKAEHGDCLVSCMTTGDHVKLGNWVRGQRKLYNKVGREGFPVSRLAKLDALGFDFDPMRSGSFIAKKRQNMFPRVNANWEKHYQNLVKFKKEQGNIIIGPNTEGWPGLYDWIHCQRKEYKKYEVGDEKALMYDKWVGKLNELGFDWAPMKSDGFSKMLLQRQSKHFNGLWMKHYGELKSFHTKHGHCYVSRIGDTDQLSSWIHVQRKHKRKHESGKKTPLSEERIKLLNDIDLDWNPSVSGGMQKMTQVNRDKEWEGVFDKLVEFKTEHGHANPKKAEPQLGSWTCRMRKLYAQNANGETTTLTGAKIAKLEGLGFQFVNTQATV